MNQLPSKSSKAKLRKINIDGPFGGKNREVLGPDGLPLSPLHAMKEEQRRDGNGL